MPSLTNNQINFYKNNGYLVVPSVFSKVDLARVSDAIDRFVLRAQNFKEANSIVDFEAEEVEGVRVVRRLFHPYEQDKEFRAIATDERILDRVESLIGPNIALQHSKLNMKHSRVGAVVEWHQDLTYFPHTNDDLVGAMVYLDDATEQNGCLKVLPRNHTRFFDHALPDGTFAGMITEKIDDDRYCAPISLEGRAGTVAFLHPLAPHMSASNTSSTSRRTLIFEFRSADAFPIYNGSQIVSCEKFTHHLRGTPCRFARFGGPPPAIYLPNGSPQSLYELQAQSRSQLRSEYNANI